MIIVECTVLNNLVKQQNGVCYINMIFDRHHTVMHNKEGEYLIGLRNDKFSKYFVFLQREHLNNRQG